jgi:hypothetical protein
MQFLIRDHRAMIAAPIQSDVDGIAETSHPESVPRSRLDRKVLLLVWDERAIVYFAVKTVTAEERRLSHFLGARSGFGPKPAPEALPPKQKSNQRSIADENAH